MSRIGKQPIKIEEGVTVEVKDREVIVKGPKGEIKETLINGIEAKIEDGKILVTRKDNTKKTRSNHGLIRTLIFNMVKGVTEGYSVELEIIGVGYRVKVNGDELEFSLGFSHPVKLKAPAGIAFEVPSETEIKVLGIDKQLVGQTAAKIRSFRKPEPFKGKGIRYKGEYVKIKERKIA